MGSTYIAGFKEQGVELDTLISIHLRGNHYPPIPEVFIPCAKRAIMNTKKGLHDKKVRTPFPHKRYGKLVPTHIVMDFMHLYVFID